MSGETIRAAVQKALHDAYQKGRHDERRAIEEQITALLNQTGTTDDWENRPIEELHLSERPTTCLQRARIDSIGRLIETTESELLTITNFGQKSLDEVVAKLDEWGLHLKTNPRKCI